jgi:hypothetical protein
MVSSVMEATYLMECFFRRIDRNLPLAIEPETAQIM